MSCDRLFWFRGFDICKYIETKSSKYSICFSPSHMYVFCKACCEQRHGDTLESGLPDFYTYNMTKRGNIPNNQKYTKLPQYIPNGQKILQMAKNIPKSIPNLSTTRPSKILKKWFRLKTFSILRPTKLFPNWDFLVRR
jgi:hypothetical protein